MYHAFLEDLDEGTEVRMHSLHQTCLGEQLMVAKVSRDDVFVVVAVHGFSWCAVSLRGGR